MASRERTNGRGDYHHGNLREALIEAAMSMIAEQNPAGFALAKLVRALGVSTSAPYKHLRDRTAVIAEVTRRGFVQLAADLEAARTDPINALERCAQAHLAFASRDPLVYAAMSEATFPMGEHQDVVRARGGVRRDPCGSQGHREPRHLAGPSAHMVALHVWTMTHGIADMFVSHDGDSRPLLPMALNAPLEAGLLVYLGSLGQVQ